MTRTIDTDRLPGATGRLSREQALDLLEGLGHRERYYAMHGIAYPNSKALEWELSLALRWFNQWWKQRADAAAVRGHRRRHASPTPELFASPYHRSVRRDPEAHASTGTATMNDHNAPLDWEDDDGSADDDWLGDAETAAAPDACDIDDPDCEACQ